VSRSKLIAVVAVVAMVVIALRRRSDEDADED
jgi:hypothetical protein